MTKAGVITHEIVEQTHKQFSNEYNWEKHHSLAKTAENKVNESIRIGEQPGVFKINNEWIPYIDYFLKKEMQKGKFEFCSKNKLR